MGRRLSIALVALLAVAALAVPAAAAEPPPDEVPFALGFPLGAPATFRDSFGDPREPERLHAGQDLLAPKGTPVLAAAPGVVSQIGRSRLAGIFVEVEHEGGWTTRYLHLDNDTPGTDDGAAFGVAPGLAEGLWVERGTLLGFVGDSGNAESTVPHLHFELRDPIDRAVNAYVFLTGGIPGELEILPEGPLTPVADGFEILGSVDPGGGFHGALTVLGGRAYVGTFGTETVCPGTGVTVVDVSNPAAPVLLDPIAAHAGRWVTALASAAVAGRSYLAVATASCAARGDAGITLYDVTDADAPRAVSVIPAAAGDVAGLDVGLLGGTQVVAVATPGAFPSHGVRDLAIFEITDPSVPRLVAAWDFRVDLPAYVVEASGAAAEPERFSTHDVALGDGRLYVAAGDAGAVVLEIDGTSAPVYRGRTATNGAPGGGARSVATANASIVVGYGEGGGEALLFDASGPGDPILLGTVGESSTRDVSAAAAHVVIAAGPNGVVLVEAAHGTLHTFLPPPTSDPNDYFGLFRGTRFYPQVWQAAVVGDIVFALDVNTGLWLLRVAGHGEVIGAR